MNIQGLKLAVDSASPVTVSSPAEVSAASSASSAVPSSSDGSTNNSSGSPSSAPSAPASSGSSSLPSRPSALEPWEILKKDIEDKTPNKIEAWDQLFQLLEETFLKFFDPQTGKTNESLITPKFRHFSFKAYSDLLSRFPYLTTYWKKFSIFEFKLNGVEASITVLSKSVDCFPHSISLWTDYLSALTEQKKSGENPEKYNDQYIRSQFHLATKYNGYHFLSHSLWDKYFEFEESSEDDGKDARILALYLQVIRIPLYQYAQYYQKFTEDNKKYTLKEFFGGDHEIIQSYVDKFKKESLEEFSIIETHQIIDDYSYTIFTETQERVNAKWPFESEIEFPEFALDSVTLGGIAKELNSWNKYLDFEIKHLEEVKKEGKAKNINVQFQVVRGLFERALIPNCLNQTVWLKYINFVNEHSRSSNSQSKFNTINALYTTAINRFIPLNGDGTHGNYIRLNYAYFLLGSDKKTEATDYLASIAQIYLSEGMKDDYLQALELLVDISENIDLEMLISQFFSGPEDRSKKQSQDPKSSNPEGLDINDLIEKILSTDSINLIVIKYLQQLSNPSTIRSFFNKNYAQGSLQSYIPFWSFYLKFEGVKQHNIANLLAIVNYVKSKSELPKSFVDAVVGLEYDIVASNLSYILEHNIIRGNSGKPGDTLILRDIDISNSLSINSSWRSRLAQVNFQLQDSSNKSKGVKDEDYLKVIKKRIGHAGVVIDSTPEITNTLINNGKWIDLTSLRLEAPDFPSFKNVEKANLPVTYPSDK